MGSIRYACQTLQDFLNRNLFRICDTNFKLLKKYFHVRHPIEPRVCIKENLKKGKVIFVRDIRRDSEINYQTEYKLNLNSGFLIVASYGRSYQCNNIPESIYSGEYHNARINSDRAKEYWERRKGGRRRVNTHQKNESDPEWVECWDRPRDRKGNILLLDPRSCYKSTLITPMTLWNNELDDSFKDLMAAKGENVERLIFGYLCFDHIQENYFVKIDEDIGYIFADILSLYQFIRLIYTKYSPYFSGSHALLKKR
jgi:hypothetical protein